jgi:hypothetical protein
MIGIPDIKRGRRAEALGLRGWGSGPPAGDGPPTGLYRLYGDDDRLLYVGISLSVASRLSQHSHDKSWWADVRHITVEHFENRTTARWAERLAILNEKPLHNVVHNVGPQSLDWRPYCMYCELKRADGCGVYTCTQFPALECHRYSESWEAHTCHTVAWLCGECRQEVGKSQITNLVLVEKDVALGEAIHKIMQTHIRQDYITQALWGIYGIAPDGLFWAANDAIRRQRDEEIMPAMREAVDKWAARFDHTSKDPDIGAEQLRAARPNDVWAISRSDETSDGLRLKLTNIESVSG